jgi:threonine synthase
VKFKKQYSLGAVNSINFARIMFQITYYFYTYFKLFPQCDGEMSFSVPTGNFGDILAGYYAKRMGLPVRHLVIATNSNDILDRFFANGVYEKHPVLQTMSPVSSKTKNKAAFSASQVSL